MTDSPKPVISDAEKKRALRILDLPDIKGELMHRALSAFLAARVPEPMVEGHNKGAIWHNACRAIVLKGRGG